MKPIVQVVLSILPIQLFNIVKKMATFTDYFLLQGVSVDCQSMWREEENIFCQRVDVVKNKNLKDISVEQLLARARCTV